MTILLSAIIFCSKGQEKLFDILPLTDGIVTYSEVVQIEEVNKDELYLRAKKWFVTTFNSAKDVIQLDDKENGEIIGKGSFRIPFYSINPVINHTLTILVKDGRFKYVITDLIYNDDQGNKSSIENCTYITNSAKKKLYPKIDEEINSLIISLKNDMKTKQTDNW